ncbi:MAG: S8 family serine peptidase [Promethearchaeota archaeon]
MSRLKKVKIFQIVIFFIIVQYSFIIFNIDSLNNYGTSIFIKLDGEKTQSNAERQDLLITNNSIPVIDELLISILNNNSIEGNISVIVESSQENLENALSYFNCYYSKNKIVNSTYFSGFSAIIPKEQLKILIKTLPSSVKYIKITQAAESMVKNTLRQLRVYPYIREQYKLRGDANTSIAILDSGIDGTHTAFQDKIIYWKDFFNEYATPTDYRGHGTSVASIACGNPWNTTDSKGRTIISERVYYPWSTYIQEGLINPFDTIPHAYKYASNSFLVKKNGNITIEGNWFQDTASTSPVYSFRLINESGIVVKEVKTPNENQNYIINYNITEANYGIYSFEHVFNVTEADNIQYGINVSIHLPDDLSNEKNTYEGVAPNCKLVALRCVRGTDDEMEIISAMNWVLMNRVQYNITAVVMSFRITSSTIHNLANSFVENGLVVSCAAGNYGPGMNTAGLLEFSPGSAAKVISVGATNQNSSLTSYSSQGGWNYYHQVIKPDILAPGGVKGDQTYLSTAIYCADSNYDEYLSDYTPSEFKSFTDIIPNDTHSESGTSFSAPFVAGASQLIIDALGGIKNWNYTEENALFVKNLLLLTATETYPNKRLNLLPEYQVQYSPTLDRGSKDAHEGYGKMNIDAALDALILNKMEINTTESSYLSSIPENNESLSYCWARQIYVPRNFYNITLELPESADFDLYIYNFNGNKYGEPIIRKKSTTAKLGGNETIIDWAPPKNGNYFIVVKGVNGSGQFNLSFFKSPTYFDHIPPICKLIVPLNNSKLNETIYIKAYVKDDYLGIKNASLFIITPTRTEIFTFYSPGENITLYWTSKKKDNGICKIYAITYDRFNNSAQSNNSFIEIFNDNIPPVIKWLSPTDKVSIIGSVIIEVKITDQHSKSQNATIEIETPNNKYLIRYDEIKNNILKYSWLPALDDDGPCYIIIRAYDSNYNEAVSDTILIFARNGLFLNNTLAVVFVITIAAMISANKYIKRALMNEPIMDYVQNILDLLKSPKGLNLKSINPIYLLNLKEFIISRIEKINFLIRQGEYRTALDICDQLLNIHFPLARKTMTSEIIRLLTDIKYDILTKV